MNAANKKGPLWALGAALLWLAIAANPRVIADTIWPSPALPKSLWLAFGAFSGLLLCAVVGLLLFARRRDARFPRKTLFGFVALGMGLALSTVGLELILRFAAPMPGSGDVNAPKAAIYGWAYGPRQRQVTMHPETGELFENRANWEGWRDVDHPAADTRPKIILLGDSQVFGQGLPFEKTPGRLLQKRLPQYQIHSVGVGGWSTDQQLLYLRNEGFALKPETVILWFTVTNDPLGNMSRTILAGTAPKPYFTIENDELRFHPCQSERIRWSRRLAGRLELLRRIRKLLAVRAASGGGDPATSRPGQVLFARDLMPLTANECVSRVFLKDWDAEMESGWALSMKLIETMAAECAARGVKFRLYANYQPIGSAPETLTFADGVPREVVMAKPYELLKTFCEKKGIHFIEEPSELIQAHTAGQTRFKGDCHLNEAGSRRTAEVLAETISRGGSAGTGQ